MNTPISFEIAKLLKEKGVEIPCTQCYAEKRFIDGNTGGDVFTGTYNLTAKSRFHKRYISAPTIAEVVMWFLKQHEIWVYAQCDCFGETWFPLFDSASKQVWEDEDKIDKIKSKPLGWYKSPTEAYEAAFTHLLNNVI